MRAELSLSRASGELFRPKYPRNPFPCAQIGVLGACEYQANSATGAGSVGGAEGNNCEAGLINSYFFIYKLFVILLGSGQFERIGDRSFSFFHASDYVGAADPVSFGEVGLGPLCRVIGMRMVEADNVFAALASLALDLHKFPRIDVVTIVRRVGAGIAGARGRSHDTHAVIVETAQQHTTAFMGIRLFTVAANRVIVLLCELQHRSNSDCRLKGSALVFNQQSTIINSFILHSKISRSNTSRLNRRESSR